MKHFFLAICLLCLIPTAWTMEMFQIHRPVSGYEPVVTLTNITSDAVDVIVSAVGRRGARSQIKVVQPYSTSRVRLSELIKGEGIIQARFARDTLKVVYWGYADHERVFGIPFVHNSGSRQQLVGILGEGDLMISDLPTKVGAGSVVKVKLYDRQGRLLGSSLKDIGENSLEIIHVSKVGLALIEVLDGDVICGYRAVSSSGDVLAINAANRGQHSCQLSLGTDLFAGGEGRLFLMNCFDDKISATISLSYGEGEPRRFKKLVPAYATIEMALSDYVDSRMPSSISVQSNRPILCYYFLAPSIVVRPDIAEPGDTERTIAVGLPTADPLPKPPKLLVINPTRSNVSVSFGGSGRDPLHVVSLKPWSWITRDVTGTTAARVTGETIGLLVGQRGDKPIWAVQIQ